MTNHPVHHHFEIELEVPGTPEEVWQAIATPEGISSWMLPTDLEPREGGAVTFHMGPTESHGQVTAFEPGHRIVFEEDWATLVGQSGADVEPLVTEFIVESRSGGSCVVRVVTSAFGTGADWENEFWSEMTKGWAPMVDNLRLYMAHFRGQHATTLFASAECGGSPDAAITALREAIGIDGSIGQACVARDLECRVERAIDLHFLLRAERPVTGMLSFFAYDSGKSTVVQVGGYLYGDNAASYVADEQGAWSDWLAAATAGTTADATT